MKTPRLAVASALVCVALAGCTGSPVPAGSPPEAADTGPVVTVPADASPGAAGPGESAPADSSPAESAPENDVPDGRMPSELPSASSSATASGPADGRQLGTPSPAAEPSPSASPQPAPAPSFGPEPPAASLPPIPAPPPTAVPAPDPAPGPEMPRTPAGYSVPLTLFYIAIDDGGRIGALIGCNDSLVPLTTEPVTTVDPLAETMDRLLSNSQPFVGRAGLYNPLWQSRLVYMGSQFDGTTVTVELGGEAVPAGTCDVPRIEHMLKQAAQTAAGARFAVILVNGVPIEEQLSSR
jgi:hypothetical protein